MITSSFCTPMSSIILTACANISLSVRCLSLFASQSSEAINRARLSSVSNSSSTADAALPSLPAAFIRGAITKPTDVELSFRTGCEFFISPAHSIKARSPTLCVPAIAAIPSEIIRRFSSITGITSATVPKATSSPYWLQTASSSPSSAHTSLNTTPTPARLRNG